ncbi:adenylate kinase 9-like [Rhynchophorus ferrugineus]|uniref:adenylate kinase 9-like n=1 Tax=Rhynchophorus ferrugineus TaxID=354439 RepID=UPI003FCD5C26
MSCNIKPSKTNFYLPLDDNVQNFPVDQTVIFRVSNLKHVPFLNYNEDEEEPTKCDEWYPGANSYYNSVEDIDPLNKVNYLLATPDVASQYCQNDKQNVYKYDAYTEREAQVRYLESKPVSFIIIGKPDVGQKELGRELAKFWNCTFIEPQTLIEEEIESGGRAGQCIEFNLRCGRAVSIDVILRLVQNKVKSEVSRHRGFVICGLPVIPNDLFEEDPVSSESAIFTAKDIFDELVTTITEPVIAPSKPLVSVSSKFRSVMGLDSVQQSTLNFEFAESKTPDPVQSTESGTQREIGLDYEKQLDFLFNLLEMPFFIIYIYSSGIDTLNKRDSNRFQVQTGDVLNLQRLFYNKLYREIFISDSGMDFNEDLFDSDFLDIDDFRLKNLVKLPSDFKASVSSQLDYYDCTALNFIKSRVISHNPEYFIKLDARTTVTHMLNIVKSRIKIMNVQVVLVPQKLSSGDLETHETTQVTLLDTEDEKSERTTDTKISISPKEYFKELRKFNVPSNMFMWSWSDWNTLCPVAMKSGTIKQGSSNYAVQFMNKIFFLSDYEAFAKFTDNPRPYLLYPFPRTSCKMMIFGPKLSGKSALARCLAYCFNGTVLEAGSIMKEYMNQRHDEYLEKIKQQAIAEALILLNAQRRAEVEELERERIENIKEWLKTVLLLLGQMKEVLEELEKVENKEHFEISSFPMQMKRIATQDLLDDSEGAIALTKLREEVYGMGVPIYKMDVNTWKGLITERKHLLQYLPPELAQKHVAKPATVFDEFVQDHVAECLSKAGLDDIQISGSGILQIFLKHIDIAEKKYQSQGLGNGGWIIDDMICNLSVLQEFFPSYIGDEVILLHDPDGDFLLERYKNRENTYFDDYRDFFRSQGLVDAIWRSPSAKSTEVTRKNFVRTILDNILDSDEFYTTPVQDQVDQKPRLDECRKELNQFNKNWPQIKDFYLQHNITPIEINVRGKSLPDIFREVIKTIENRYKALPELIEENPEEIVDVDKDETDRTDAEDTTIIESKSEYLSEKSSSQRDTFYCPVTFYEKWILWRGKDRFMAKYNNQDYSFCTEDDLKKFLEDPSRYVFSQPQKIPPPRICIVGVTGSGKTTLSRAIANNYGLMYVSFDDLLGKSSSTAKLLKQEDDILEKNVEKIERYWLKEPFRSRGFVIDDFPRSRSHVDFMTTHKLIPDLVLYPSSKEAYLKTRFVDRALKSWQESVEKHRQEIESRHSKALERWRDNRTTLFNELMEEKRQQRYSKKLEARDDDEKEETMSQVSFDSVAEQEDVDEVNKLVDSKLPPLKFDVPLENPAEFLSKTEPLIFNRIQKDMTLIESIREKCVEMLIPFAEIDLNLDNFNKTIIASYLLIEPLKFRTASFLENTYEVSLELADRLLLSGYFFLSKFGKTCPVQAFNNTVPIQSYMLAEERNCLYPVIHRSYIYFVVGPDNRSRFLADPLKYINAEFKHPLITFRVGVTGPPKCGKSNLAQRIHEEYGFKIITRGSAVRYVLKYLPLSDLAQNMETVLRKGWELTDEMVIRSVEAASFDKRAATLGIVFDGFPNSINEAKHLSILDILPNIVVDIGSSLEQVRLCLSNDVSRSLPKYSDGFMTHLYDEWKREADNFRAWFDREYQGLTKLSIAPSRWALFHQCKDYLETMFWEVIHYHRHIRDEWPLRLGNMLVTPLEFLERQSIFKHYCPVCLHFLNRLISSGEPPDRTGLIQFRFNFYWICNEHVEMFLKNPDKFLPPVNNHKMPSNLPKALVCTKIPDNVYENGACAICYKANRVIVKGKLEFAVSYNEKTYLFDSKNCLKTFLSNAEQYMVGIEFHPPQYPDLNYKKLPILGMLEQYLANYVVKGVTFVAQKRPVIPGLNVEASALVGLGLFIKTQDEKLDFRLKCFYEEGLKLYNDRREKLLDHIETMKTYRNPYVHYQEILPPFKLPPSIKSESLTTMVSRIVDQCVDNMDLYLYRSPDNFD